MSLVRTFTHLANQPHAPEALHTLKRIADLMRPIMKRHGWVLPAFSEFFPDDERLLGLNVDAGAKILIRLRPARNPGTFYPIEQLVRVMLHELTHNVYGPHDEHFYAFLNKLEDEYDALVIYGWQGTGFHAPGERLGSSRGSWWGDRKEGVFDTDGRRKALEAAEARRRAETFSSGGRLGGSQIASKNGKTRRELAAEAAERRRLDERLCAASHPSADREAARATTDSIVDIVADDELAEALQLSSALAESTAYPPVSRTADTSSSTSRIQSAPKWQNRGTTDGSIVELSDSEMVDEATFQHLPASHREQQCPTCTYRDPTSSIRLNCAMCNTPLPERPAQLRDELWTCAVCTLQNPIESRKCEACDFPRKRAEWAPKRRIPPNESTQNPQPTGDETWVCELCTLVNVHASRVCSLCDAPCPLMVPPSSGSSDPKRSPASRDGSQRCNASTLIPTAPLPWDCRSCGKRGIAHDFWMCGGCGWIKTDSGVTE